MSRDALSTRRVDWSSELTAAYLLPGAPSMASCNSALFEVVAIADRLAGGTDLMTPDRSAWVTPTVTPEGATAPVPEVGRYLNAADLRQHTNRTDLILALAQVGREIGGAAPPAPRSGAWVQIAIAAVAGVLVGVAVHWLASGPSSAELATRVRQAGIVEAGRLGAERVRVAAATGQPIAPPGPIEVAASADIRAAAEQARAAGIGQSIEEASGTLAKAAMFLGGAWALAAFFTSRKGS